MRTTRFLSALAALFVCALSLTAQSELARDFAKGPAQWLMTAEEKKAWRGVKTEEEAQNLVALFWARRDPTPGTLDNEFRPEFRSRVDFANRRFKEGNKPGSLTERGRVLILLGIPSNLQEEDSKRSSQYSTSDVTDPTGGRALAARDVWLYKREEAVKFGLPKIEVVFIRDGLSGHVRRDTQRNDFLSAIPAATNYYIKNPSLTAVPEWAKAPKMLMVPQQPAASAPAVQAASPELRKVEGAVATVESVPAAEVQPASVGKLTLVSDAFALQPESGTDPFAGLTAVSDFRKDSELGWVAEYCTGSLDRALSNVEVTLKITGLINGERVNFNAPPEDLVPDSIKASPGCYLVRGGVPLMEMDPANYTLFVKIGSYNLTREFRVIE
jgi:GWxTD domain-containing protein